MTFCLARWNCRRLVFPRRRPCLSIISADFKIRSDIESMPFVEALRQLRFRVGEENFAGIHVTLVPSIHGELKTKPTQASIRDLRALGLVPDLVRADLNHWKSEY